MPVYLWSETPSLNGSIDPTVNFADGQSPSSINDSARAMMAAVAKWRDDISGALVTGGSSTSYTVSSNSNYDTLAHLDGQLIVVTPHVTNGAGAPSVLLSVDGLAAKPIRTAPATDIPSGTLIQGTPYPMRYSNVDGAFYLAGFFGNPYNIPLAGGMDFWGTTAPNSSFAFPFGQPLSRTIYATLFGILGTTFGNGDGSTTFNLPDCRGRTVVAASNMGGSESGRLAGANLSSTALGGTGGEAVHQLGLGELPTITSTQNGLTTISRPNGGGNIAQTAGVISQFGAGGGGAAAPVSNSGAWNAVTSFPSDPFNVNATSQSTGGAGGGTASSHNNVQPTIIGNRIMRII